MSTSKGPLIDFLKAGLRCKVIECNLATDPPQVLVATPVEVLGYWVNTVMSAHSCGVADNATNKVTIPASSAAGTYIQFPAAVEFATNLTVNPNASATGIVAFFYRDI